MLRPDVVVVEVLRLAQRELEHFFARGVKGMCPLGAPDPRPIIRSTSPPRRLEGDPAAGQHLEASPSPIAISPRSRCSVPM